MISLYSEENIDELKSSIEEFQLGEATPNLVKWKTYLVNSVSSYNLCKNIIHSNSVHAYYVLIGKSVNVQASKIMIEYLIDTVERISKEICTGRGKAFASSFKMGMVSAIEHRLQKYQQEVAADMQALIIREDKEVKEYINKMEGLTKSSTKADFSDDFAMSMGYAKGKEISLNGEIQ